MSEYTYIIIDDSPLMKDDFQDSVDYILDLIVSKLVRGKKKDFISVVTVHDKSTSNPMNDRSPEEWQNCVLETPAIYNWEKTVHLLKERLEINHDTVKENEADIPRAIAIALQHISDVEGKRRRKSVKYSVLVISNWLTENSWDGLIEPICSLSLTYDVLLGAIYFPHVKSEKHQELHNLYEYNLKSLGKLIPTLRLRNAGNGRISGSFMASFETAKSFIRDVNKEPPRLVSPIPVFRGEIRLFCDINAIDMRDTISSLSSSSDLLKGFLPEYDKAVDSASLYFMADGYPLTKKEITLQTKEVAVMQNGESSDSGDAVTHYKISRIKYVRNHYVYEQIDDEDKNEEQPPKEKLVTQIQIQNGYKYGMSIIPATSTIQRQLKTLTHTGIDIMSIANGNDIPPWYFKGESVMLLPGKSASTKDVTAFCMFSQALMVTNSIAIARVVQKPGKPASLAALVPSFVLTEQTKRQIKPEEATSGVKREHAQIEEGNQPKQYYGLTMVSLFFGDERRFASFGKINRIYEHEKDHQSMADDVMETDMQRDIPTKEMVDVMEQFVKKLDLDGLNDEKPEDFKNENRFVEFNDFDTLPIPWSKGIDKPSTYKSLSKVTRKILSQNSPKVHFIQKVVRVIYRYFLDDANDDKSSLYDLIESSKMQPVSGDSKAAFDILQEMLEKSTEINGRNVFIPDLYDKNVLENDEELKHLLQRMEKLYDVQKTEKKDKLSQEEINVGSTRPGVEKELASIEQLLGIGDKS